MKQTGVNWLIDQLNLDKKKLADIIYQAQRIEEAHIMNSFDHGWDKAFENEKNGGVDPPYSPEEYGNTYFFNNFKRD
jgi:hypothetical protein